MKSKSSPSIHTRWFQIYKAVAIKGVQNQRHDKPRDKRSGAEPRNRPVNPGPSPTRAHVLERNMNLTLTGFRFMPSVLSDYKEVKVNQ